MSRSRASARKAGSWFQSQTRDAIRNALPQLDVEVAPSWGAKDKGDLTGVKNCRVTPVTVLVTAEANGDRLAIECKNVHNLSLSGAIKEAQVEAKNYGAQVGVVVHKRHGVAEPLEQYVSMTMADFLTLIGAS